MAVSQSMESSVSQCFQLDIEPFNDKSNQSTKTEVSHLRIQQSFSQSANSLDKQAAL
jgi:hypothetical protein